MARTDRPYGGNVSTTGEKTDQLLWPTLAHPDDLAEVERIPLADRGLPASTHALLTRAASMWPERTALTLLPDAAHWQEPVTRTFAQVRDDVEAAAQALRERGIGRGDTVALMSPNCLDLIVATLAAQVAGIAVPINPGLADAQIVALVRRSGATVLVAAGPELDENAWESARTVASETGVAALLALRPTAARGVAPALEPAAGVHTAYFSDEVGHGRSFDGPAPTASDLAAFFHTGGTTGDPKLAAHSHENEVANAWMIAAGSDLGGDDTVFAALPLFHVNALVVTLLAPLLRGQAVVWAGPLGYRDLDLYANFWKIVEQYGIATMSAVPTVYAVLAQCPVDADIASLRSCIVGASALPSAVRESFESAVGVPLLQGYGLTEATCASVRSFREVPRHDSVGQRFPYQHIKAIDLDEDGAWEDLPAGEIGTIAIAGPTVFRGYVLGRTDDGFAIEGLGKLRGGWVDTGDLGRVDDDGFLRLTGRAKDLIIRGGHNIDPAMIEDALLAHQDVTGAAAVGSPDPHAGEVPVAYVTVTAGSSVTTDELIDWARSQVAETAAAPKSVTILDALPVTDVGKPYKVALRADATRTVAAAALRDIADSDRIRTEIENGEIVVVVETTDNRSVENRLGRYAVRWRIETPTRAGGAA
jgi:fatty-acyl-CoA synthase